MLQGLARELDITRRVLAAVPDGQRDYRPDPEARSAWELACHLASCDVRARNPEQLTTPADFLAFNLSAVFYLSFINNHSIHHRGQLAVYLRPMSTKGPFYLRRERGRTLAGLGAIPL